MMKLRKGMFNSQMFNAQTFFNSQEGKYRGVRITEDMSPGTVSKIKADRLHRKRANSRGWHCKFESAGVS